MKKKKKKIVSVALILVTTLKFGVIVSADIDDGMPFRAPICLGADFTEFEG